MKKILFVLAVNFFAMSMLQAQKPEIITSNKPGWHKIGEANVDFKKDKDQFLVMGADKFRSVQLRVSDAPVHIASMQVYYEGGQKEDVSLRSDFNPGSESRVINLKNHRRGLKKVAFVYHTVPNRKAEKGHIELWGLK